MASGWEYEGLGFKPRWLQATFDPGLPKKEQVVPSQKQCALHEKKFARRTLKKIKDYRILKPNS